MNRHPVAKPVLFAILIFSLVALFMQLWLGDRVAFWATSWAFLIGFMLAIVVEYYWALGWICLWFYIMARTGDAGWLPHLWKWLVGFYHAFTGVKF